MHIFTDRWRDGFLDEAIVPGNCRLQPEVWLTVQRVEGLYFVRQPSLRMLWNYSREIGARNVLIKVASRRRERSRNEKWLSCGVGRVLETSPSDDVPAGTRVVFLAPCHPRCMERLVLSLRLVRESPNSKTAVPSRRIALGSAADMPEHFRSLQGWSPLSGFELDEIAVAEALTWIETKSRESSSPPANIGKLLAAGTEVEERRLRAATQRQSSHKLRTCLFGYGNFAKTVIIPNLKSQLMIDHIHEIDPTQIGPKPESGFTWDTSPTLRRECQPDVVVVAGYHHTHASIAIDALDRGASVVLEKPLATTSEQVDHLIAAMTRSRGQLFSCFQKRYLPFQSFIREDLDVPHQPIDYHCIVYEEPLPPYHWYRWPSSRSRLTSNGCHWIDHFLYLNDFVSVASRTATVASNGAVVVHVELVNTAVFTMALTDRGSPRIGLQDHVELRSGDATVRIVNSTEYVAERGDRVVRRAKARRLDAHAAMYKTIATALQNRAAGDSRHSVEMTSRLVLDLEAMLVSNPKLSGVPEWPRP